MRCRRQIRQPGGGSWLSGTSAHLHLPGVGERGPAAGARAALLRLDHGHGAAGDICRRPAQLGSAAGARRGRSTALEGAGRRRQEL